MSETTKLQREHLTDVLEDAVADLLYYDRNEDESLPRGAIEQIVQDGTMSIPDMLDVIRRQLEKNIPAVGSYPVPKKVTRMYRATVQRTVVQERDYTVVAFEDGEAEKKVYDEAGNDDWHGASTGCAEYEVVYMVQTDE